MLKKFIIYMLTLLIAAVVIPAQQISDEKIPIIIPERPDIIVDNIKITKLQSVKPGKVYVKIEFWLSNKSSKPTRCCPTIEGKNAWNDHPSEEQLFRVRIDARYYPNGRFFKLNSTSTEMAPNQSHSRFQFQAYFIQNKMVQIRVVADPGNWINEKDENNNFKKVLWPVRTKKILLRK